MYKLSKNIFDFFLALILIVVLSPVFLIVSAVIKIIDGGAIFYAAQRVGLYGKKFNVYKFKTMVVGSEKIGGVSVSDSDHRVTRFGKFLRKSKLNELPQLFNILKGEMSFVGPRPEVEYYTNQFKGEELKILSVKPGITDFSSIKFRNESEILEKSDIVDKDKAYEISIRPEKIRLQLRYLEERSFWLDIRLILETFVTLFK